MKNTTKRWISLVSHEFCAEKWDLGLCIKASAACSLCLIFCAPSWLADHQQHNEFVEELKRSLYDRSSPVLIFALSYLALTAQFSTKSLLLEQHILS